MKKKMAKIMIMIMLKISRECGWLKTRIFFAYIFFGILKIIGLWLHNGLGKMHFTLLLFPVIFLENLGWLCSFVTQRRGEKQRDFFSTKKMNMKEK